MVVARIAAETDSTRTSTPSPLSSAVCKGCPAALGASVHLGVSHMVMRRQTVASAPSVGDPDIARPSLAGAVPSVAWP